MANALWNMDDHAVMTAPQRPVLRLVEPTPRPKMTPPSWMLAPPIPAAINAVSVNEPQQPYLPIQVAPMAPPVPAASNSAPYRNIREVPRLG